MLAQRPHRRNADDTKFLDMPQDAGSQLSITHRQVGKRLHGKGFDNTAVVVGMKKQYSMSFYVVFYNFTSLDDTSYALTQYVICLRFT